MKILVVCQYYFPEPFRITDICEELVKQGHEVTVVTGTPNYPLGEIYSGYENRKHSDEILNGVKVHRCSIHPRKTGPIHRLWNYYSYAFSSSKYIKKLDNSYDVVLINQLSPVMMANAGIQYARKHKKKCLLYCLDLWPASLRVGGVNGGLIYKWFHRESKRIYRTVDAILASSKSFETYFEKQFNINDITYLPQFAEDIFNPEECCKHSNGYVDLMFAGNVGIAQRVDVIINAAAICKDIPNLKWHIVGDGIELENCKNLAKSLELNSVVFHGRKALEVMPTYYAMADAMLVTMQKDPIISLTLPGKVQTYMAAGKPIIGAVDGEANFIINDAKCGLCCATEDAEALAECVREFILSDNAELYSKNAVEYYQKNFTKKKFMSDLVYCLER